MGEEGRTWEGRGGAVFALTFPSAGFELRNISKFCGINLLILQLGLGQNLFLNVVTGTLKCWPSGLW